MEAGVDGGVATVEDGAVVVVAEVVVTEIGAVVVVAEVVVTESPAIVVVVVEVEVGFKDFFLS